MSRTRDATLITNASRSQTLELAERQKRYLITMGIRTGCFLAFLIVPGWWKLVALGAAALLPAFAVLFANNADHHAPTAAPDGEGAQVRAITTGDVVRGTVEEETDK
ncbi:Protein of unknown function [Tessaracoccus bendigoensis DSM 12906]|uniref:DUF3099 domain-containing protein n=1 Tax=Tessaracoccus bendigoensis DSM 12906 TaxID=1123357 RepID=A0A1M6IBN7_9ACTN|nr:DUF3099 domain-containing protein [Tessaracoccus bendigoensis]SHJ31899.1 Protein of unknown function [Tessaracoccus bendigoensis DSM 12906]